MGKYKIEAKEICTFYFHSEVLGTTRAMFLLLSLEVINVLLQCEIPVNILFWVLYGLSTTLIDYITKKTGERIAALHI